MNAKDLTGLKCHRRQNSSRDAALAGAGRNRRELIADCGLGFWRAGVVGWNISLRTGAKRQAMQRKHRVKKRRVLVLGAGFACLDAEVGKKRGAVEYAKDNVGVADVHRKQHAASLIQSAARQHAQPRDAAFLLRVWAFRTAGWGRGDWFGMLLCNGRNGGRRRFRAPPSHP